MVSASLYSWLQCTASFSVPFVRALGPAFPSLPPELGSDICSGFPSLWRTGSLLCSWLSIHVQEQPYCMPISEGMSVSLPLSVCHVSLFCLAFSLFM